MIGRCLERANVTAVVGQSCGTCTARPGFSASVHGLELRERLRAQSCAFAQLPRSDDALGVLFGAGQRRAFGQYALATPAILHWPQAPFLSSPHCVHAASGEDSDSSEQQSQDSWPLMIVGAQKAATTSLHERLAEHPAFCASPAAPGEPHHYTKEKHFFDHPERCSKGVRWYQSLFPREASCSFHVLSLIHISEPTRPY